MIPLKLHVKNFVSYGSTTQTIDFTPYALICLSGKNGHGKSALLDALTWVLWGQARKISGTTKADEWLLRLGQTTMMVSLDFMCNKETYRIRREYNAAGKTYSTLDFGIIEKATGTFKTLTDKTIKLTQEKVQAILGLDFEAFINSAFLRQGQSNEFSKKTPKDRKEILASILRLDHFESLRKKAYDHAKSAAQQKEHFHALCKHFTQEIQNKLLINSQITELIQTTSTLTEQENIFKQALCDIKKQQQELGPFKVQHNKLQQHHEYLTQILASEITLLLQDIYAVRTLFRQKHAIIDYTQLDEERLLLYKELQQLQLVAQKKLTCKEQLLTLKEQEKVYREQLTTQVIKTIEHYKQLSYQSRVHKEAEQQKQLELINALGFKKQEIQRMLELQWELEKECYQDSLQGNILLQEKQLERRKAYYQKYSVQITWLKSELTQITAKKELTDTENSPLCPLCQQVISQQYKEKLSHTLTQKEHAYIQKLDRITLVSKKLKLLLVEQHNILEVLKKQIQEYTIKKTQAETLYQTLRKQKQTLEDQEKLLSICNQNLALYSEQQNSYQAKVAELECEHTILLSNNSGYRDIMIMQAELSKQIQELNTNPEREREINSHLQKIALVQQEQSTLLKELALKEQRKKTIAEKIQRCKQLKLQLATLIDEIGEIKKIIECDSELVIKENHIVTVIDKMYKQKAALMHQKGTLEQQKLSIEQREEEYENYQNSIKKLDCAIEEYQALALAFSKDGIQALLIEDALPEIEHEANILLSKLTDNQAQLSIESLRDLRSGATKETLDIKISDTIGIRPYELFSGGEAFRIDFALRIAISKLLARRAGTALQTLIIDEGFGSQDEEGLNYIMEALYKIQDDFAKIIIVSHLPALKEQFPVHFLVHKGPQGSVIKIIEQG